MGTTLKPSSSGHTCGACEEEIKLGQEIFCLRVHRIYENEEGVFLYDQLDCKGEYVYLPYFLCTDCWEEDQEDLANTIYGAVPDKAHPHLRQCDVCMSSVISGELVGLIEFGALHLDERQPDSGERSVLFLPRGEPYYLCTCCLNTLNVECREYWDEPVRNNGECELGVEERCWRTGECEHVCKHERAWQWASENITSPLTPSKE